MWNRNPKNQPKFRSSRAVQPIVDSLEHRELYAVNPSFSAGTLTVSMSGNDAAHSFVLKVKGIDRQLYYYDGRTNQDILYRGAPLKAGQISRITVVGDDFGNEIDLSNVKSTNGFTSALDCPASPLVTISGQGGNDKLVGSQFADKIDGGSGDDTLQGMDGNDILIAGTGRDLLYGNNGDDLLISSSPSDNSSFNGGSGQDTYRGKKPGRFTINTDVELKFYS
ncbi:MAG: hypothetical protein WCJ40_16485 [Planctomycetota bacterium]